MSFNGYNVRQLKSPPINLIRRAHWKNQTGILDRTHTRLFTFRTMRRLLRDSGFQVQVMKGIPAPISKAIGDSRLSRALTWLNQVLIRIRPGLFSYQIFVSATVTPDVAFVLASTRASIEATAA